MIIALIIWISRKYLLPSLWRGHAFIGSVRKKSLLIMILLLGCSRQLPAGETGSIYEIKHKGKIVGRMQFKQYAEGDKLVLKISSEVKTKVLIDIEVQSTDYACFRQGRLLYSSVSRRVNGKEKESKVTRLSQNGYELLSDSKTEKLETPITYNMMMLYYQEPLDIRRVYSDNFQQWINLKKTAPHTYRADLPGSNYNDYYYRNGVCYRVDIHHSFYSIQMDLI